MPDFTLEQELGQADGRVVIGLDEAGRGPWAGPVVAAAAWLDPQRADPALLRRLDDSKKLTARRRDELFEVLCAADCDFALLGIGEATVEEIDAVNILEASLLAMRRAAAALAAALQAARPVANPGARSGRGIDAALVDGNRLPGLTCETRAVVKGDSRSLSIAAASVVAKVTRDRAMAGYARDFPGYGWERNQGYGTAEHRAGIARLGITPLHRRSFRPVREALESIS